MTDTSGPGGSVRLPFQEGRRFDDMSLSEEARAGLRLLGYEVATPVQATVFEHAMSNKDLMVQSKTGTGKTTAFGLPLIEKIDVTWEPVEPQALVLCPTRELAVQISEELASLGDPKGVRVLPIYGGAPVGPQLKSLKMGCDVVVGTPGRLLDHIRRRTLKLDHTNLVVLDEADEILSMGFWEDVTAILEHLPKKHQTLLFSATLPEQIRKTALAHMTEPLTIDISRDELTVDDIGNVAYETDERIPKPRNLLYVLEVERPDSAVIFCNTRDDASVLAAFLRRQGLHALALSGELSQREREQVMRRMKSGELRYLVATDIAARGIDISDLSHVVNYSLPDYSEVFLHRVGRTGRIGKKGTAISLVSGRDEMMLTELERRYGLKFEKRLLPDLETVHGIQAQRVGAELLEMARETEITSFLRLAEHIAATDAGVEVFAFLLKGYFASLEEERAKSSRLEEGRHPRQRRNYQQYNDSDSRQDDFHGHRDRDRDRDQVPPPDAYRRRKRQLKRKRNDGPPFRQSRGKNFSSSYPPRKPTSFSFTGPERDRERDRDHQRDQRDQVVSHDSVRLFVNRGAVDGYDQGRLVELFTSAMSLPTSVLRRIHVRRTHSYVEVDPSIVEKAMRAAEIALEHDEKPAIIEVVRNRE